MVKDYFSFVTTATKVVDIATLQLDVFSNILKSMTTACQENIETIEHTTPDLHDSKLQGLLTFTKKVGTNNTNVESKSSCDNAKLKNSEALAGPQIEF